MSRVVALFALTALLAGCEKKEEPAAGGEETPKTGEQAQEIPSPGVKVDKGVDLGTQTVKIGALNDESGPAATIGKPYAQGKRLLAAQVNAGGTDILPEGWKVELVEKDHGYDPGKAQQAYQAIAGDVLFIATSFGTPPTLPLRPFLQKDEVVAFPASLSSQMAEHRYTPPVGPPYTYEARRALDWMVTSGDTAALKPAIIYDQTDYGQDGLAGFEQAAEKHGVEVVAKRAVKPGQKDFTADVTALKEAGATHVLLTVLPSSTGPLLATAAQMQYAPVWVGNTPSWVDAFFAHPKLPPAVFANFHWVTGMPYWGEDVEGMDDFLAAYKAHGQKLGARPDFYVLVSYIQGLAALEAVKRAIEERDVTRAGYLKALQSMTAWDAGGLIQPLDFSKFPYVTGTRTRVLKPDFEKKTWTEVAGYADPALPKKNGE